MIKRDILAELATGVIDEQKALADFDDVLDSAEAGDIINLLGFTSLEYRAYCHGVSLPVLAAWRRSGWPQHCFKCGAKIELEKDYWWAGDKNHSKYSLRHIDCF